MKISWFKLEYLKVGDRCQIHELKLCWIKSGVHLKTNLCRLAWISRGVRQRSVLATEFFFYLNQLFGKSGLSRQKFCILVIAKSNITLFANPQYIRVFLPVIRRTSAVRIADFPRFSSMHQSFTQEVKFLISRQNNTVVSST